MPVMRMASAAPAGDLTPARGEALCYRGVMHHRWRALWSLALVSPLTSQQEPHVNRLARETSPYLLQHAHNPVDWYPWGEEALARAKREDKPIFLSIGYSACHWCHVMERESFENQAIARLMNEKFVNIKVDREERPDLDDIYMTAVVQSTGRGGWPMSVFLTPDLEPFLCGTYYPPEDWRGMPGFRRVIEHVDRLWRERREDVERAAADLAQHVRLQLEPTPDPGGPKLARADAAAAQSAQRADPEYGGFGHAPKFPHTAELSLLLRHHARTGNERSLAVVRNTLLHMLRGGIYDQLGGGFHRYSTDREWLVPHFEKMLYDNALLARTLAEAFQVTGEEVFARVLRETLDYLLREMQGPQGGFFSAQDADSENEEGKFFVWDLREIESALGADAAAFCLAYGVTDAGNWEHRNILHVALEPEAVAARLARPVEEVRASLQRARATLLALREERVHPHTDDKVLTAWNGLAIAACAIGHQVCGDARYLDAARRAAEFALGEMRRDGRLLRTWRAGEPRLPAYLEDYAFLADGLLCLFEADFDPRWLAAARELLAHVEEHFLDPRDGGLFFTADDHEQLIARSKSAVESSVPSGQAVAALAFLRAGALLGEERWSDLGAGVLRANASLLEAQPLACPTLVLALELVQSDPCEVVIAGAPDDAATRAFLAAVRRAFPPHHVVALLHDGNRAELERLAPMYADQRPIDGRPTAYVCRRGLCEAPVTDPSRLRLR
jgi:uncharacterized protein YyaL (SSP411 family)